jgi:hypothetical protein
MRRPLTIGRTFRFSELHMGRMEVISVLGHKHGKWKYRVKYENGRETVVLI